VAVFGLESWLFVVGVQAVDLGQHRQQSSHWHSIHRCSKCAGAVPKAMVSPSEGIQITGKPQKLGRPAPEYYKAKMRQ